MKKAISIVFFVMFLTVPAYAAHWVEVVKSNANKTIYVDTDTIHFENGCGDFTLLENYVQPFLSATKIPAFSKTKIMYADFHDNWRYVEVKTTDYSGRMAQGSISGTFDGYENMIKVYGREHLQMANPATDTYKVLKWIQMRIKWNGNT